MRLPLRADPKDLDVEDNLWEPMSLQRFEPYK